MSITTASGVSGRSAPTANEAVRRETCLSMTKLLLDIPDTAAAEGYKKLIADMGGELTKAATAHVAVATSYTKTNVRVRPESALAAAGRQRRGPSQRWLGPGPTAAPRAAADGQAAAGAGGHPRLAGRVPQQGLPGRGRTWSSGTC
jgi:hypothetical protein